MALNCTLKLVRIDFMYIVCIFMYIYHNKNKTQAPTLLETQAQKVFDC